jgi:hypothetical protein
MGDTLVASYKGCACKLAAVNIHQRFIIESHSRYLLSRP